MTDDRFRLTALDARRWDFGNALRGYDRARVDEFRDQVAEELERMARANQELETKANNFLEQLRVFRDRDKALNEALVSAQQLRGDIRAQAEREAQLIVREAHGEAERVLASVQGEVRRAEEELQQLWRSRQAFLAQLRSVVERQATEIAAAERMAPPTVGSGASASATMANVPGGGGGPLNPTQTFAVPTSAALNPTQAFPIPAIPHADEDVEQPTRDERLGFRLSIDTTVPDTPGLEGEAERVRPSMPTPSWLDAVDDDETK
jgi:DivIVA domain-containing protein